MAYPYSPYTPYMFPQDLSYLMPMMFQWMIIPYYYMIYMEVFKTAIETWRKAFESMGRTITPTTP